ncbi:LytR/AlgR family response regulator transcription factor [Cytobacillus sp. FJAT-54145]|uniref:LytR/AlgR family response regulator transcription factor n=1 Tax=Cytobacillus spartinae TaxID=3299023 RepID=A0ABW6K859_9BACI
MDKMRVLVVDDEHYSRVELKHLLGEFPNVQVVGEADSGEGAIMKVIQLQPDVVFLDVEMPKLNGMEVAKSLLELKNVPIIVFATAYPQFAAEAFRYEAIDYLLKPFDEDRLSQTVTRIEKLLSSKVDRKKTKPIGKLAVEGEGEILYIEPKNIKYIYREEKVSKIITVEKVYEVKLPLKDLEARLAHFPFFRIHKSYLVNLDYVTKLTPWFSGTYQLEIENSLEKLPVSRNYLKELRSMLEI